MKRTSARYVPAVSIGLCMLFAWTLTLVTHSHAQEAARPAPAAISLDPPTGIDLQAHLYDAKGNALPEAPANFRRLGEATVGETAELHALTLRFAQGTKLTGLSVSKDFRIEQGGSCVEGDVYAKDSTCTVLVRFTPQGAGNRLGKLMVSNSVTAEPMAFGLNGNGYAPIVSFVPALISTVPGTYPGNVGLLSGASNLTVDGADNLYAADTGNNIVRMLNSSGAWTEMGLTGVTAPIGIGIDNFGEGYVSTGNAIYETYAYPFSWFQISGTGTDACRYPSTCTLVASGSGSSLSGEDVLLPGAITFDNYNNMYFAEETSGVAWNQVLASNASGTGTFTRLYDPFTYQTGKPTAFAYSNGYLYSWWPINCALVSQTLYNAEQFYPVYSRVAGGRICGFAGDNGLAGSAELSSTPGQISFDVAGNMYYADSGNQRVRRIDLTTGVIRTVAGNGTAGYLGDGAGSWGAELSYPTGVAVNSQGAVFVISGTGSTSGGAQVIRQVGPAGFRNLGTVSRGVASAPATILVTNTGNATLVMTGAQMVGANAGDFAIDPGTTTCLLTPGATLLINASCNIGVKFTPSAVGSRTATLNLLDNSVTGINSVTLIGVGALPSPTFAITSPANGASFPSGTAVTLSVSVTSGTSPAPTGTVQFKVDGANYGGLVTLSSGTASTSVTGLTQTTHTLAATYSGDANYAAAGPASVSITVTAVKIGSLVTLSETANTATGCTAPQFAASVTGGTGTVPTGTVQLLDGAAIVASGALSGGSVLLDPHPLTPGAHSLTASYGGDGTHLPSVSSPLVDVVAPSSPCTGPVNGGAGVKP